MTKRRDLLPYLLIGPLVVCELVVHVVPTLLGLVLSLRHIDQFTLRNWSTAPFVGARNYRTAFDPSSAIGEALWSSLGTTALFALLVALLSWALGLFAAVLLSRPFRGRWLFQVIFIIPFALPGYVTGIGWRFMFARDDGAVNHLLADNLHLVGHHPFWLVGDHAFWATVVASVWRLWPFAYVILLAAMSVIRRETYEAAAINGAHAWGQFRHVTWPALRQANWLVAAVLALWSFNEFAVPLTLLGDTPPESATLYSVLVYRQAFGTLDVGVAAATNVAVAVALSLVAVLWVRRWIRHTEVDR